MANASWQVPSEMKKRQGGRSVGRPLGVINISFVASKTGCWLWKGKVGKRGYGVSQQNKKAILAHRLVYEFFKRSIEPGKELHHLCGNKRCVNPEHLQPVSRKEHIELSPNAIAYKNGKKSHCPKGHQYKVDEAFLRRTGKARRFCHVCRMQQQRARRDHQDIIASRLPLTEFRGRAKQP